MQLKEQIERFYRNTAMIVEESNNPKFDELKELLDRIKKREKEPLRVAIAGFMKAGKSTLMNAILREKMLYTGFLVTTYTVTWFKYGKTPSLSIVFKDGTSESAPIEDLKRWTVISYVKENSRIRDVLYVILYYPNEMLKKMELIDTPGLFSPEDGDAQNTMDFLGLKTVDEMNEINHVQTSNADAIIYAFGLGMKEGDLKVIKAFTTTPINALGVFTKTDQSYWDFMEPERSPLEVVKPVVERLSTELLDDLYRILPVTAIGVEGTNPLAAETCELLIKLAGIDNKIFMRMLSNADRFVNGDFVELTISKEQRKQLLDALGQYGIYLAVTAIKKGVQVKELSDYMYEKSGVEKMCSIIMRHFGNRAYLIKTGAALKKIDGIVGKLRYQNRDSRQVSIICNDILDELDKIRQTNCFRELDVLRDYYSGNLKFPDKEDEKTFLKLTGEDGSGCEARLGVPQGTSIGQMKGMVIRMAERWSYLSNSIEFERNVNQAADIILHSLQEMYLHLDALAGFEE